MHMSKRNTEKVTIRLVYWGKRIVILPNVCFCYLVFSLKMLTMIPDHLCFPVWTVGRTQVGNKDVSSHGGLGPRWKIKRLSLCCLGYRRPKTSIERVSLCEEVL